MASETFSVAILWMLTCMQYFIQPCYVGPCHHGMARPSVADGGDGLQIWSVAAKILITQSRTVDKGRSSRSGVGRGTNDSSP